MKKQKSNKLLIFIFLIGLSLLLYPSLSNYWNSLHQTHAIAGYVEDVTNMDRERYQKIWQEAVQYNQDLSKEKQRFSLTKEQAERYEKTLDISDTGMMGYIEIPSIKVSMPIYHGVDEGVLQIAAGHLDWTSLPVGGSGTHCVLSGHRGLPSAKLFTNLDELETGDIFRLRIMEEVLTYEVDQILIVEPDDLKDLMIVEGKDLCTLVTCTPYGVNSHRLLVRGHRIESDDAVNMLVTSDALQIDPFLVAPVVAAPILIILFVIAISTKKKA